MDFLNTLPFLKILCKHLNSAGEINNGNGDDKTIKLPNLHQLLNIIGQHMNMIHDKSVYVSVMPLLEHAVLQLQSKSCSSDVHFNLGEDILDLLNQNTDNPASLQIVVQILYQILIALPSECGLENGSVIFSPEVAQRLMDLLFSTESKMMIANLLACLQLYIEKFNGKDIANELYTRTLEHQNKDVLKTAQIIVELFNKLHIYVFDFMESKQLSDLLKLLLVSKHREERKAGIFIAKKIADILIDYQRWNHSQWGCLNAPKFWSTYVTVLENLEENQAHLILPSLQALQHYKFMNPCLKPWQDLLFTKILCHSNIQVRRWAILYVLETLKYASMSKDVLLDFLSAVNDTSLYEGNFITKETIEKFLGGDVLSFLEYFVYINWKSVPLHVWLQMLPLYQVKISFSLLKLLATRVRMLPNSKIRGLTITLFEVTFKDLLEEMNFIDYLTLLESLYNASDSFEYGVEFIKQRSEFGTLPCENAEAGTFTKKFYELLMSTEDNISACFESALENVPIEKHGWLRFYILFSDVSIKNIDYRFKKYDIDMDKLISEGCTLAELTAEVCKKLVWNKDELSFVREKCVDLYVARLLPFSSKGIVEKFLNAGSVVTLGLLSERQELNESTLDAFLVAVKRFSKCNSSSLQIAVYKILNFMKKNYSTDDVTKYAETVLDYCFDDRSIPSMLTGIPLSQEWYIKNLLFGEQKTGDARIEDCYYVKLNPHCNTIHMRTYWARHLLVNDKSIHDIISKKLLEIHMDISKKKPRYYENSKEHRIKMRIAYVIKMILTHDESIWLKFWDIVFNENNQLNITCLYEYLIVFHAPNLDAVAKKLKDIQASTPSQQVSFITVMYYCLNFYNNLSWSDALCEAREASKVDKCINTLLPYTMGANFQVRFYAQLMIYDIIQSLELEDEKYVLISKAIETAFGPEELKLRLHDIRIALGNQHVEIDSFLWATNAPYDEYTRMYDAEHLQVTKELYSKRTQNRTSSNEQSLEQIENTEQLQRKMNIANDNLIGSSTNKKEVEMFVVTTLVDKVANIGGLARTCEVLGIKNLVLRSIKYVEAEEFRSLSMTAEKGLNLIEVHPANLKQFLLTKQAEGFEIVGAEQTSNSLSFVDFEFPKKCVLLLGHEKTGIPADLLHILNYAVEIPQFGIVRSLNVHVTGALFMWAFCKEHMVGT